MKNKILSLLAAGLMLTAGLLQAAPTVLVYEWAVQAGKAGEFAAALDTLQKSKVAKDRTAQLHLEAIGFNGVNPATHRIVVLYPSIAEMESWNKKFAGSDAGNAFRESTNSIASPVAQYMEQPLASWGTVSNDDKVFDVVRLQVSDAAATAAGLDALMTASESKDFPGQIWLIQVLRGNAAPDGRVTHQIVVGYESLAEMEAWQDYIVTTKAWQTWAGVAQDSFIVTNRFTVDWLSVYDHNYTLEDFD
ncbi:MAG: hypothetical protein P8P17_18110 [Pseudomonadales bacterium]|nr:hypothetical protein [Pseudomonadales bacterium]